ncbi:MAG: 16S rRNA (cytosine(1402)-N(4))-methyltransferase RsmH [Merdibacter sp.]
MMEHYSVLLQECLEGLHIREDGIYVDATLGRGGHSAEILKRCPKGHLYAFDRDAQAIAQSLPRLRAAGTQFTCIHSCFSAMQEKLAEHGVSAVDGILMDLGVSSPQFDEGERGFSYRFDAPLDMRMDQGQRLSAWHVINEYPFEDLCRILKRYGEEPFAKQIARAVERRRAQRPIDTTFELVEVIRSALPAKVLSKKGHPAKRTFQAVRMEVNSELQELEAALQQGLELLRVGGRMCVISFHSLEDRMVKEAFVRVSRPAKVDKRLPLLDEEEPCFNMISRKPITAAEAELRENNRSHSAKLRIIEKVREQHG